MPSTLPARSDTRTGDLGRLRPSDAVLIIGTAKAATTSLYSALVRHPDVCGCVTKEPFFFSDEPAEGYETDRYDALFPDYDPAVHRRYLEASTSYTAWGSGSVPERIRDYGLTPRFIYVVRNPIDRIQSAIHFTRYHLNRPPGSFTDFRYVVECMYATQLRRYLRVFPDRDRYWVVDFDDLVRRPEATLRAGFSFLGLDPTAETDLPRSNAMPKRSKAERALLSVGARRAAAGLIPWRWRQIAKSWLRRVSTPEVLAPTEQERAIVHHALYDDMQGLRREFGIDVGKWGF
jgi:hypothetical protein